MPRLTKKFEDNSGYEPIENHNSCNRTLYDFNVDDYECCVNKLGKLEDLEEELGCPLEVVFKALKEGYIWVYDSHYNFDNYTKTKAKITFNNGKFYIGFARNTRRLQDYKKTWWLQGDKYE